MTMGKQTREGLEAETATRPSVTVEANGSKFADPFQFQVTVIGLRRIKASAPRPGTARAAES